MNVASPERQGSPGRKFNADGSVCRFPGNAILCRVGSGNPGFGTIDSIQSALRQERFARRFAFVPSTALHMTIFDGAKAELRDAGFWPADMHGKSLAEVTALFREKLTGLDAPSGFRMKPTEVGLDRERGSVIRLAPGDHAEARRLRVFRERLSDLLDLRLPAHADYTFHITLSHLVAALDPAEAAAVTKVHSALTVHLSRALSMLEFGWPEFCTHENLAYYERVFYLGAGGH